MVEPTVVLASLINPFGGISGRPQFTTKATEIENLISEQLVTDSYIFIRM